jgi:tRNA dimethylallyltransferase
LEQLFTGPNPFCQAEIVSADSMQVYRGMDIGTAKPSPDLFSRLPHHLIDIRNPDEQFNAGDFVRMADEACEDIARRGKLPVVSGGTGFYLRNFVLGLPKTPPSDPAIREQLQEDLRSRGAQALMEELAACDPASAIRIHINDTYRLQRALEVFRTSGRPLSSYPQTDAAVESRARYRFLIIGLERNRAEVYRRINQRCALMFRRGLPEEVARLHAAGYGPGNPGMKAIGYQEFFLEESPAGGPEVLRTEAPQTKVRWRISADLEGVQTLVARNSRRYAKRQITFFASIPQVKWISAAGDPAGEIRREAGLLFFGIRRP